MVRVVLNPRVRQLSDLLRPTAKEATRTAKACDVVFRDLAKEAFDTEGASTGTSWEPLSEKYAEWKLKLFAGAQAQTIATARSRGAKVPTGRSQRAKWVTKKLGSAGTILQLTGDMMRAFTKQDPPHQVKGYVSSKGIFASMGVAGPNYWSWHQDGGPKAGRPPQRSVIQYTTEQRQQFRDAAVNEFEPMIQQRMRALAAWRAYGAA